MSLKFKSMVKDCETEFESILSQLANECGKKFEIEANFAEFLATESDEVKEGIRCYKHALQGISEGIAYCANKHGKEALASLNKIKLIASSAVSSAALAIEGDVLVSHFKIEGSGSGSWLEKMDTNSFLENNL